MVEGGAEFLEAEGVVKDGTELVLGEGAGHRLEAVAGADRDPLKPHLSGDDEAQLRLHGGAGQHPDHGKRSARSDRPQRLRHR